MVSHSKKQQHDRVGRLESVSILFYSSWSFFQSPHVPFKLKRFQFFPFTANSRVYSKERFFQDVEGKGLQVILSLFSLSLFVFVCALLMCFAFKFWVCLVFMLWLFNMFLFGYFSVLLCFFFFSYKNKIKKFEKSEKYKNSVCFVYIGTCVP